LPLSTPKQLMPVPRSQPGGRHTNESTRPIKLVTPLPAREGWDERQVISYETSPNERAVVEAIASRAGSTWTVFIVDASQPTLEKRAAQIELLFESLRPKGYKRESFADRKPEPLDEAHIAEIKKFVETSMQELGIPGVSIALIDGGKIVHLAARYSSKELGELDVLNKDGVTTFDFGEWKNAVASRKNDDGTISFITIDPTNGGFDFVVGERDGKRVLIIRDGQHEYVLTETS